MVKDLPALYEYPFKSNFLDNNGIKQHYLDEGSGPIVVMLHGNPTWSYYYRNLVSVLSKNHRCIVPDHIGCGLSDKPRDYSYHLKDHIENTKSLLKSLGIKKYDLIVHDWGGAIGMGVATASPENVNRIVIMNTAAFRSPEIPLSIAVCRIPVIGEWGVRCLNAFLIASRFMATSNPLGLPGKVWEGYKYPYDSFANRIAIHRFVMDIPLKPGHPSYSTLKEIEEKLKCLSEKKIRVIWGMKDFCFTNHFLSRWKEIFPNAEVEEFKNASHLVLEDESRKVIKSIKDFLKKVNF